MCFYPSLLAYFGPFLPICHFLGPLKCLEKQLHFVASYFTPDTRICNHCAPPLPPGHTLGQVSTYYPLWIFSTAATHMTTSVTVSRTSADKVIHRGVITNMCTGWALRAVRSIHNIHSAHSARGRGGWRCIDVCSVLQCRYTIVTDHSSANSNEPCVASIWAVDSRYYIVYSRYYIVDKYTL